MKTKLFSWVLIIAGILALFFSLAKFIQAYDVPKYEGFVNDYANIISKSVENQLETDLQQLAASTNGAEIAVATITSLNQEPIEMVAQDFFDSWKIGKADTDNGVLLLVAVDDREVRIQTGYGAEAVITDSYAGRIIRNQITPAFKEGNYDQGILAAVGSISQAMEDPSQIPSIPDPEDSEGNFALAFFVLYFILVFGVSFMSYVAAFIARSKSWWLGGVVGLVLGGLLGGMLGGIAFALLGLALDYILSKNYKTWKIEHRTTAWRKTMGGFSSSGGGSRSSSFGGGSSGGGGASGSW
jgi:uncharacterized protein